MPHPIDALKSRLTDCLDLEHLGQLLYWDMATYLPPRGHAERGRQMALVGRLGHEMFTSDETGKLLAAAEAEGARPSSPDAALLRVARREFDRAVKVPSSFVAESEGHYATLYDAWTHARPANDFASLIPLVEKSVELARRKASFFPGHAHVMDPHIDVSDPGMSTATIRALFDQLRAALTPLVQRVCDRPPADDACLRKTFPIPQQIAFGERVVRRFGYDFERGRQDKTVHPFMIRMGLHDVRITTRLDENFLGEGLFSTLHEAGHALYEQGVSESLAGTLLMRGVSAGVHESQSRLWENLVGRSLAFWDWAYPELLAEFPNQLAGVSLEAFYQAINRVERSLVRVEADELTYNLHVMIRFDLECALLEGSLAVKDLPAAWNARYQSDLGLTAPDDRDGVLQDVHWYGGGIGGCFQGYTLGNIIAAQCFDAAVRNCPGIPADISRGDFSALREWLTRWVYAPGRIHDPADLVRHATGQPLTIEPYVAYLTQKFGDGE